MLAGVGAPRRDRPPSRRRCRRATTCSSRTPRTRSRRRSRSRARTGPTPTGGSTTSTSRLKKARWLDRLVPFLRPDGASIVPAHAVTAPGQSFEDRIAQRPCRDEPVGGDRRRGRVAGGRESGVAAPARRARRVGRDRRPGRRRPARRRRRRSSQPPAARSGHPDALRRAVGGVEPGDPVRLRLRRKGKQVERTVSTVAAPDDEARAIIGVRVSQDADIELPVEIEIDLGDVGGPSAGLAVRARGLPGARKRRRPRRTASRRRARSSSTAQSSPVGGIKQKTFGVAVARARTSSSSRLGKTRSTARRYAGDLRVIPVESFEQALRALRTLSEK